MSLRDLLNSPIGQRLGGGIRRDADVIGARHGPGRQGVCT